MTEWAFNPSSRTGGRPALACAAVAAAACLFAAGCGGGPSSTPADGGHQIQLAQPHGAINRTTVIPGPARRRDDAADGESADHLDDSDWQALERMGPRPMWEAIENNRRRANHPPASNPTHHDPASRPAPGPKQALVLRPPGVPPTPAAPSTQPSTQPATRPAGPAPTVDLDESALPVEVTELPDGRLRIIWVLRSFGGPGVKTARDPNTARRTVELSPPDLAPLVAVLTPHLGPGGSLTPLAKENTLVITCDKAARPSLVDLLARLDVPPRQVEITAKIFEVSHDFDFQQGSELLLNRLATDGGQQLASTFSAKRFLDAASAPAAAAAPVQGSVLKLMQTFADAGVSVDVSFQLLSEAGLIRVVSAPRMTVAVGQTGYMLAGQELPIQSANIVNNALQTLTTYKPVGVQLYITPQSSGVDRIKLHTITIVSAVSGFAPLPTMDGNRSPRLLLNPVIDSREAETAVTIADGDTLVISGLRMARVTTREEKIPGLGDLPLVGNLFKNHRDQQQMTDLYFFLTPTILDDATGGFAPAPPAIAHVPRE